TIRKIFNIGHGPSSSHTMGPQRAAEIFKSRSNNAVQYIVTLYGSLAATGRGHLTDKAILEVLGDKPTEIIWQPEVFLPTHPNGMKFSALNADKQEYLSWEVYSVGGGELVAADLTAPEQDVYRLNSMDKIRDWCLSSGKTFWEYIACCEDSEICDYLAQVWEAMQNAIKRGLDTDGSLPGPLALQRKAYSYFTKAQHYQEELKHRTEIYAYALAVAEENAAGGIVVTAPTCGSSGVLPAVLFHLAKNQKLPQGKILRALATAGLVGNLIKHNASISGAEVGCQGEIGSACAMAAAAVSQLSGQTLTQIEYAAEIGLEHNLGLTCDPVCGLVQIPCIERNAFAAMRALDASLYAGLSDGQHIVSLDNAIRVMYETGRDLSQHYKETSIAGLAANFKRNKKTK
ncbi:MAG: L-serine ammonia-lyase, partial [Gammaproteobacteria bacterium]|nr:L-serine ammonia-lyase [Gammaproteobacteria bacterium]